MKELHIDIETYSSVDLSKSGVYKYAESNDFEILLFGYSKDGEEAKVIDLARGEMLPEHIIDAIWDDSVIKTAHNANFERVCLSRFLGMETGRYLNPNAWRCTLVWGAYLGLPLSLSGVGSVLGLDKQKLSEGKELIRYFCMPCSPTKTNGGRVRNLPEHDTDRWDRFISYNKRDVEVEMEIQMRLSKFPLPDGVWEEYFIDQEINDRGVKLDMTFVEQAIRLDEETRKKLMSDVKDITGLENPNSVQQMKGWLKEQGLETESLGKKQVEELEKEADGKIREVLMLRKQLAKSSVKKYMAMRNAVCRDGRARGMFQFYGANRTGRFSGRLIQLQNLPQNHLEDLAEARCLVRNGDLEAIEMLYEDVPGMLSQLLRTAFVADEGNIFYVADFSAIEARVLSWLAGEQWRVDVFENGGDIYCASASQMFHVPVEKHGVNGHLRQKGKIAELALGYGGSVGALTAMGALSMGLTEDELKPLVDSWRAANPAIVGLWWEIDRAAKKAIKEKTTVKVKCLTFSYQSGFLFITLPSGRRLAYVKPAMGENRFGGESITYEGVGATKKWERLETYGPKLVENIIQGIARDILCYSMKSLRFCSICMHVHDELVIEGEPKMNLDRLCEIMGRTPPWTPGLSLSADGYITTFYKKD